MRLALSALIIVLTSLVTSPASAPQTLPKTPVAELIPVGPISCKPAGTTCPNFDAVVFVHGIYGSDETFVNSQTGFDWPKEFPRVLQVDDEQRRVDVYRLNYLTTKLTWARDKNPTFLELTRSVETAMKSLRKRQYRSIGFIVHSLGGNVVSTYLTQVKLARDHAALSQHAYLITLATPVLGSQVADLMETLKSRLGMTDDLLNSLERNNIYLQMLNEMKEWQAGKATRLGCRPVNLHVGVESKYVGPILIVGKDSAALPVISLASSPIVGFQLNHLQISKPADAKSEVYIWAMTRVEDEMRRLTNWEFTHDKAPKEHKLCARVAFEPES